MWFITGQHFLLYRATAADSSACYERASTDAAAASDGGGGGGGTDASACAVSGQCVKVSRHEEQEERGKEIRVM